MLTVLREAGAAVGPAVWRLNTTPMPRSPLIARSLVQVDTILSDESASIIFTRAVRAEALVAKLASRGLKHRWPRVPHIALLGLLLICLVPYTIWLGTFLSRRSESSEGRTENHVNTMKPVLMTASSPTVRMPRIIYGTVCTGGDDFFPLPCMVLRDLNKRHLALRQAWKKERTQQLVREALQAGFRGIDTACQPKHYYEGGVGAALAGVAGEASTEPTEHIFRAYRRSLAPPLCEFQV